MAGRKKNKDSDEFVVLGNLLDQADEKRTGSEKKNSSIGTSDRNLFRMAPEPVRRSGSAPADSPKSAAASDDAGHSSAAKETQTEKQSGAVYFADKKRQKDAEKAVREMPPQKSSRFSLKKIGPMVQTIQSDPRKKETAYRIIVLLLALLLAIRMTSVMNDIMGFTRGENEKTVQVTKGMTTSQLIGALDKAGLVKHSVEDRAFIRLTSGIRDDAESPTYLAGEYVLTPNMGIEKMLSTCQNVQKTATVSVTFPEGYTVEQMAARLEKYKVCAADDFITACNKRSYNYSFVKNMSNPKKRYHALEGYLYPDTYQFYEGEDAESVVDTMLGTFNTKWKEKYKDRAAKMDMSMNDVIILASIVQKEDSNSDNMAIIASVFYNRLNSSSYPNLQSDTTTNYLEKYVRKNVTANEYKSYKNWYSTYICTGLPVGAVCNPGDDAITAVLWPETTNYYFFSHDSDGNLFGASTAAEQESNLAENGVSK